MSIKGTLNGKSKYNLNTFFRRAKFLQDAARFIFQSLLKVESSPDKARSCVCLSGMKSQKHGRIRNSITTYCCRIPSGLCGEPSGRN